MKPKNFILCGLLLSSGGTVVAQDNVERKMPVYRPPVRINETDTVKEYFPAGGLQSIRVFYNYKQHGPFAIYLENGEMACHGEYQAGQLIELVTKENGENVYHEFPFIRPAPVY
jgi:hypothetical protein